MLFKNYVMSVGEYGNPHDAVLRGLNVSDGYGTRILKLMDPEKLSSIAASGQAAGRLAIGQEIDIPWTYSGASGDVTFHYTFFVADIGDCYDDEDVKHENAVWLMAKYCAPVTLPFDAPQTGYQYGHADWSKSVIRQWLNSDAARGETWWESQETGDSGPSTSEAGWLNGFGSDWLDIIKPVRIQSKAIDSGRIIKTVTTYDRFFNPSMRQLNGTGFLGATGSERIEEPEERTFAYFAKDSNGNAVQATNGSMARRNFSGISISNQNKVSYSLVSGPTMRTCSTSSEGEYIYCLNMSQFTTQKCSVNQYTAPVCVIY